MKKLSENKKVKLFLTHLAFIFAICLLVGAANLLLGGFCPLDTFFKIPCPFCGMTRAHLAALRLDFAAALNHHPLFFLGIPYLWLLFHEDVFFKKKRKLWIFLIIFGATLFLGVYIFRFF